MNIYKSMLLMAMAGAIQPDINKISNYSVPSNPKRERKKKRKGKISRKMRKHNLMRGK